MPAQPTQSLVLTFEDARRVVEDHASLLSMGPRETVDLLRSAGRILAESLAADRDIPPFPRSTRDGYAVYAADLAKLPAKLKLTGEIKAGPLPGSVPSTLNRGDAFSIMTGAPVPQGADAVVMIEYTSLQHDCVEITKKIASGENIVAQGAEAKRGSLLLDRGTQLNEAAIALAASIGKSRLQVFVRPRVAVLTTGDEIVDVLPEEAVCPTLVMAMSLRRVPEAESIWGRILDFIERHREPAGVWRYLTPADAFRDSLEVPVFPEMTRPGICAARPVPSVTTWVMMLFISAIFSAGTIWSGRTPSRSAR